MTVGKIGIGIAGGDRLPLLGESKSALHGSRWLGADPTAGWSPAPRHATAAAMEQGEGHPVLTAHACDRGLSLVERPVGRQIPAVLVAVRVSDHHHLLAAAHDEVFTVDVEREQLPQDLRRRLEIVERLEQGRHMEARRTARPAGQQEDGEHIRGAAGHRDDERAERFAPIDVAGPGQQSE